MAIPHFLLLGIGSWIYGTRRGLLIMIPAMFFHMYLLSHLHADIFNSYQTKLTSPLINILLIELVGNLKLELDRIKSTNERLDKLINLRNAELSSLTLHLLETSENIKIANGQELHDGIGQQLTGIQLLSASLSEQLLAENSPTAAISHHLINQTSQTHHYIRKISRQLFPVRIGTVGLTAALNELSSCLNDIKPVMVSVDDDHKIPPLPEHLQLQLFRICQESIIFAMNHLKANRLDVKLNMSGTSLFMTINHNGNHIQTAFDKGAHQLIRYRLKQISGKRTGTTNPSKNQVERFSIPLNPCPV
ncbi:histidine kinase [Pontiellaceae bacterium B12227]|nr:histidine kinase [Pontiellaceae bacterium B12227]